jgi:hypothetical protein
MALVAQAPTRDCTQGSERHEPDHRWRTPHRKGASIAIGPAMAMERLAVLIAPAQLR